jgi:hypothetical protein
MRVVVTLFYVLAALGALAGALEFLLSLGALPSVAPLDVFARSARAIGFAVIPLCLARAVEGLAKPRPATSRPLDDRAGIAAPSPESSNSPQPDASAPATLRAAALQAALRKRLD